MENEDKINLFRNMAEADPSNELAHFSLGKLYKEAGRFEEAETSLKNCLEVNQEHSVARQFLGESLLELGRKPEAIELLEASILMAHERGEFMPRDAMSSLLREHGIEPPDLTEEEDTEAIEAGAFVCKRCRKARPGLDDAPFSGELGARVQEDICVDCWKEWMAMSVKVINEFRLNMATPEANDIYESNLREFLGV
ncbi:MAG: hypothetical protein CMJ97_08485 [Planctomycetes bacterium]|nr:hypothetical protein [Planctomycetota bacterium]